MNYPAYIAFASNLPTAQRNWRMKSLHENYFWTVQMLATAYELSEARVRTILANPNSHISQWD